MYNGSGEHYHYMQIQINGCGRINVLMCLVDQGTYRDLLEEAVTERTQYLNKKTNLFQFIYVRHKKVAFISKALSEELEKSTSPITYPSSS